VPKKKSSLLRRQLSFNENFNEDNIPMNNVKNVKAGNKKRIERMRFRQKKNPHLLYPED
jgi:hypothetical protein